MEKKETTTKQTPNNNNKDISLLSAAIITGSIIIGFSILLHGFITAGGVNIPQLALGQTSQTTNNQPVIKTTKEAFLQYGKDLKLNNKNFEACITDNKYKEEIASDIQAAQAVGAQATPTTFVNGIGIRGAQPFEKFQKVIENELNGRITNQIDPETGKEIEGTPAQKQDVSVDNDPILGDKNAPVTIVEFSDFQCPFCKSFNDVALRKIKTEYVDTGKAKLVFRDLPLTFHKNAELAATAAQCAGEQNKFWEYHDILFAKQNEWSNL